MRCLALRLFLRWRRTQDLESAQAGGGPGFHAELLEDVENMLLHRGLARSKNDGNLAVRLALGDPKEGLRNARGQAERPFKRPRGIKIRLKFRDRLLCRAFQAERRSLFATGFVR